LGARRLRAPLPTVVAIPEVPPLAVLVDGRHGSLLARRPEPRDLSLRPI
jgi:hypothetical protein